MKADEAVSGRFVELGECRYYLVGKKTGGDWLAETKSGAAITIRNIESVTLLPPECDSFDWKPETFPQYWTARPEVDDAVFLRVNEDWSAVAVYADGSESDRFGWWKTYEEGRKPLTEAEALAMLDKPEHVLACNAKRSDPIGVPGCICRKSYPEPVESPDDWVTQDRMPARPGIDQYRYSSGGGWRDVVESGNWDGTERHNWVDRFGDKLFVRCRREDLPPLPEPAKPATRKVVLTEWLCEKQLSGEPVFEIVWSTVKPVGAWMKAHAIGTREIEVPL